MKILHAYNIGLVVYIPIFLLLLLLFLFLYDDKGIAQGEWVETKAVITGFPKYIEDGLLWLATTLETDGGAE